MTSKRRARTLWQIVGLLAVIAFTAVLAILFVDLAAVMAALRQTQPAYLLAGSLFLLAGLGLFATRWRFLLQNRPAFRHTFHASNIGHAGNMIIPGRVGEPLRILVMGQSSAVSYTEAVSSFVVERLFEQIMRLLALFTAVALGSGIRLTPGTLALGVLLVLAMVGGIFRLAKHRAGTLRWGTAVLARLPRISPDMAHRWLADWLDNLQYVASFRRMGQAMGWSLLSWGCFWLFFYLTLLAFGDRVPAADRMAISMGALALSPPSAATQPGLFHGSVVIPLTAVGFDEVVLVAYAIILHMVELFWIGLLALLGLVRTGISPAAVMEER